MDEAPRSEDGELRLSESQIRSLLYRLCVDLGFCFPADVAGTFETNPPRTIVAFTDSVFVAEGLDPARADRLLYDQVRAVVATTIEQSAQNVV
jgi:hypothetical protein